MIRVHDLAKEYGVTSREMLGLIREMKIPVRSASSRIEDAYVSIIRYRLRPIMEARGSSSDQTPENSANQSAPFSANDGEYIIEKNDQKTSSPSSVRPAYREVSPNLASAISVVASIDRGILFDPALLPGFVADIAPDLEAEVRLVEIACMVGAIDALGGHGDKAARVREARDRLVSSFVEEHAVDALIAAFTPFLKGDS